MCDQRDECDLRNRHRISVAAGRLTPTGKAGAKEVQGTRDAPGARSLPVTNRCELFLMSSMPPIRSSQLKVHYLFSFSHFPVRARAGRAVHVLNSLSPTFQVRARAGASTWQISRLRACRLRRKRTFAMQKSWGFLISWHRVC